MIKKIFIFSISALFFAACGNNSETGIEESDTTEITSSEVPRIKLSDFDSLAGNYVGKEVTVSGIVDHVCKKSGKKIFLVNGDYNLYVYNDNRFDESLSGSKVTVKGTVEQEVVDSAYLANKLQHELKANTKANKEDKMQLENMTKYINKMQDSLKKSGLDHFTNFSLKFISFTEEKK